MTNEVVYTSLAYRQSGQVNGASPVRYSACVISVPTGVVHSMPRHKSVGAASTCMPPAVDPLGAPYWYLNISMLSRECERRAAVQVGKQVDITPVFLQSRLRSAQAVSMMSGWALMLVHRHPTCSRRRRLANVIHSAQSRLARPARPRHATSFPQIWRMPSDTLATRNWRNCYPR